MKKNDKSYTIQDIAQELGVSKTTVSRALSGKGRISSATIERVRTFVEQHNYKPNKIAQGLAKNKTYNLGLVIPLEYTDIPFFKECMDGICEEASRHNYDIMIAITREDSLSQLDRLVTNHKVDGIILTRTIVNSDAVKFLKRHNIPFLVIGPSEDSDTISIDNPNQEASRELTQLLLMKGLRKLALIGGSRMHYVTESRKQGFLEAHRNMGFHADPSLLFMEIEDYRQAVRAVDQILLSKSDGIICMDDNITTLVLGCLREKGVEIPSAVKLASLYDSPQLEHNLPPVTSLHFTTKELGKNACIRMLEMLGEVTQEQPSPLHYQVILRESTK